MMEGELYNILVEAVENDDIDWGKERINEAKQKFPKINPEIMELVRKKGIFDSQGRTINEVFEILTALVRFMPQIEEWYEKYLGDSLHSTEKGKQ